MNSDNEEKPNDEARMNPDGDGHNGTVVPRKDSSSSKGSKFHRGKWTNEECQYMLGLMEAFKAGQLPLREGTTLRSFLSSMMKCKPKRISKKFEGISYNGRMVYQKSKHPISLQASMLLRARLSELERRYLEAAREQREGHDSIDALLRRESHNEHQETQRKEPFPADSVARAPFASLQTTDHKSPVESQFESNLSSGFGFSAASQQFQPALKRSDDMARLLTGNGVITGSTPSNGPPIIDTHSSNTTSTSARLADSSDTYRILSQRYVAPSGSPRVGQPSLSDFHSSLSELERQKTLTSLPTSDAASTIAAMKLRERVLATQLSQSSVPSGLSLGSRLSHQVLPAMPVAGLKMEGGSTRFESLGPVRHDQYLNRYILQTPQDDDTYFRQRLLPAVTSLQSASNTRLGASSNWAFGSTGFSAAMGREAPNIGDLSKYANLRLDESGIQGISRS